ncbi:hypothetical protein SAMN04488032_102231 [Pacificibacter marinus]|uniref:Uncharacterized protein n=1 Tax=Pacificibacter marinus TaxID=658057 RepID=A0A1Y5RTN9_9RHOB|nr:hypothetical protein [Pacificibacter marinus]SEK40961.1 hypothetical protein SAMN04488032_102231 [Pacificibacter marinus]SLN24947.1 hypothetical protein PAM7971_00855 [Pacificibacter marinus]
MQRLAITLDHILAYTLADKGIHALAPRETLDYDDALDPGGLIRESYRIENITLSEARSIFLDWAIKLGPDLRPDIAIRRLLGLYEQGPQDQHPMTLVLREGLGSLLGPSGRRGGSRARRGQ